MARATGSRASQMTGDMLPKGYDIGQIQKFTPESMQLLQHLQGFAGPNSYLSKLAGGDQGAFEQLEAPALRQFQALQGQTASRFSGIGMGGRRSSGFQNYLGQQTSDFAQQLQANRMAIQKQALADLRGISGEIFSNQPYERFMIEKEEKKPWWRSAIQAGLPIAGAAVGGAFGGVPGAKVGAMAGSAAGSAFA